MSVYGSMLPYFSELQRSVNYFEQDTKLSAGYIPVGSSRVIQVIYQNTAEGSSVSGPLGRLAKRSNWTNMAVTEERRVWTTEMLNEGGFIYDPRKGRTYRIMKLVDWEGEGDFNIYTVEKVVGNKGTEIPLPLKEGSF